MEQQNQLHISLAGGRFSVTLHKSNGITPVNLISDDGRPVGYRVWLAAEMKLRENLIENGCSEDQVTRIFRSLAEGNDTSYTLDLNSN